MTTIERDRITAALPGYDVGAELGRGGWGVVLEGRHRQLGREVAIKQLPEGLSATEDVKQRFIVEARLLASLDHPHVVPIYDYVEHEGLCLLVMEKLGGGSVWDRFTASGLTMQSACAIAIAANAGLTAAHARDILHRDVKPENLLFTDTDVIKLADFGIAKVVGGSKTLATKKGEVIGTPAYMAPEQVQGDDLSAATDVYAVGVMLFELLSGRLPFADEGDPLVVLFRHAYEEPDSLADVAPSVPPRVAEATMRALARAPEERYGSAESFSLALAEAATDSWGPGWLDTCGIPVMATREVVAATQRPSAPARSRPAPASAGPVRPSTPKHEARAAPVGVASAADLLPVQQVVKRPSSLLPAFLSLVLVLLVVAAAFLGIGDPSRSNDFGPGAVTVAGADATNGTVIRLDLSKPIDVSGTIPPSAAGADRVRLSFSAAGLPLGSARAPISVTPDGRFTSSLDATTSRYLVPGKVTGELALVQGGVTRGKLTFSARAKQPGIATAPGAVLVVVLLFVLASIESTLRLLRRRRRRVTDTGRLLVLGAVLGVVAAAGAWVAAASEPTVSGAVVCAALGAGAIIAAGEAARPSLWRVRRRARAVSGSAR